MKTVKVKSQLTSLKHGSLVTKHRELLSLFGWILKLTTTSDKQMAHIIKFGNFLNSSPVKPTIWTGWGRSAFEISRNTVQLHNHRPIGMPWWLMKANWSVQYAACMYTWLLNHPLIHTLTHTTVCSVASYPHETYPQKPMFSYCWLQSNWFWINTWWL